MPLQSPTNNFDRLHRPSTPIEHHTTSDGTKPKTAISATTDPDFLPALEAPATQHVKFHLLLVSFNIGCVVSASFIGFELFHVSEIPSWVALALGLGAVVTAAAAALNWAVGYNIDWWLSMPVAGNVGLLLVIAQEQSSGWHEVD